MNKIFLAMGLACTLLGSAAWAQPAPAGARIAAQRSAMQPLAMMDGVWRGPAVTDLADGSKFSLTQTERVGAFLDGSVKVIEGRGYDKNGGVVFNAFGTISFDPTSKKYSLHSYAQGYSGDHAMTLIDNGFVWELPAGPAIMRFTIIVKDGVWHEVGERIVAGATPVRFFEMKLKRVGDTSWPAGDAVPPK